MDTFWLIMGFVAQAIFGGRFIVQWIASERAGRSVVPISFWFLSLFGGVLLFCYSLHRKDPVFIFGQALAVLIYLRNLYLIHKERQKGQGAPLKSDSN